MVGLNPNLGLGSETGIRLHVLVSKHTYIMEHVNTCHQPQRSMTITSEVYVYTHQTRKKTLLFFDQSVRSEQIFLSKRGRKVSEF